MSCSSFSNDETESELESYLPNKNLEQQSTNPKKAKRQRLRGGGDSTPPSSGELDDDDFEEVQPAKKTLRKVLRWMKIGMLLICWLVFTVILIVQHEHEHMRINYLCAQPGTPKTFTLEETSSSGQLHLKLSGPFAQLAKEGVHIVRKVSNEFGTLVVTVYKILPDNTTQLVTDPWEIELVDPATFDVSKVISRVKNFRLHNVKEGEETRLSIEFMLNGEKPVPIELVYEASPVTSFLGICVASGLLIGLFGSLTFDIVHRALSSLIFCTLSVSMLAVVQLRPTLMSIISWINFEVLLLLFGLTIIVAIIAETGIIDYLAVRAYEMANGHIWPMLNMICLITLLGAALFDNIFMILIIAPITLRICEVMELNPVPVLTCVIVSSNVGSTVTPTGDAPNAYINTNDFIRKTGMNPGVFVLHVLPGTLIAAVCAYCYMRIQYYNTNKFRFKDGAEVERLRRVIKVWSRTAKSISVYSKDEKLMRDTVMNKVRRLRTRLQRIGKMPVPTDNYEETLKDLKAQYPIRNRLLLIKCIIVMTFTVVMSLLHLVPDLHHLSMAWIALLGAILLLIIADHEDFDGILGRIEWSTMLFLATMFVFTESLSTLGWFDFMGEWMRRTIMTADEHDQLLVAIVISVGCSALFGAFFTDASVGNMMIRVAVTCYEDLDKKLPLHPLLWGIVLGTSLGSIGTIIGTYGNIICAGLVEKHGYNFPYLYYLKVGFPIMIFCVLGAGSYLLVAHCIFSWH